MRTCARIAAASLVLALSPVARAANINAQDAPRYVGETATICGVVASTNFARQVPGKATFLDMDKPYPNETVTVLIWGEDRDRFGALESTFLQKRVCATGQIQLYRGRPQVIVHDPRELVGSE
jgi:hypothetical protein